MIEKIRVGIDIGADAIKAVILGLGEEVVELPILLTQGRPLKCCQEMLCHIAKAIESITPGAHEVVLGMTGSGSAVAAPLVKADRIEETNALTSAIGRFYPNTRTVVEMGRENQKYIRLDKEASSNRLLVVDSNLGHKCAAGSGSFLDHMAKRLNFEDIEEFAKVALEEENPASLSGRCSVFTESDIVHLYQKGTPKERIAAGVHQAIARNYRQSFCRGRDFQDEVLFIGGVSQNPAVKKYLSEELKLNGRLTIPSHNRTLGAIGAALQADSLVDISAAIASIEEILGKPLEYKADPPLSIENSVILPALPDSDLPKKVAVAGLGIDIGSVSTKAALVTQVDGKLLILASHYRRTDGDPLAAVKDTLSIIQAQLEERGIEAKTVFAATTGSGRYLTADYVGADLIKNEITAQAQGALAFTPNADTVLEIGGQDSKFIRLEDGTVVDFEMNKACAAGCGAFLEKQASRLDIPIEEFGGHALKGTKPPALDWMCTVFTESSLFHYQQAGVLQEDLCAAVCRAAVYNYQARDIGSHSIGENIVFQGAVAFNKGMVAAFETILGKKITVPPYPHLTGAIGAAWLAFQSHPQESNFRGFAEVANTSYQMSSFECKSCPNACDVNVFAMANGQKFYYNDRCEKYSGKDKHKRGTNLPDLFQEREEVMLTVYRKNVPADAPRIGIPRGLLFTEYYPFFNAFLTELGFQVVPSEPTNKRIIELGMSNSNGEPCFPFKVAHGHYMSLIEQGVDYIFAPGILSTEQPNPNMEWAQTCPYLQAAPEVIGFSTGLMGQDKIKYLTPRLHFIRGPKHVEKVMCELAKSLGKTQEEAQKALKVGIDTLATYRRWQQERGREILKYLSPNQPAFVVVSRPYALYDEAVCMSVGKKIRDMGILPIPQDFLPLDDKDISDIWHDAYSRQIQRKLAAARIIRQDPRLHAVVLTYFGCGQDSFANPFFKEELGEPCYVMQIDEHTADAGVITRLEAFSDTVIGKSKVIQSPNIQLREISIIDVLAAGKILWIPNASEASRVLAASLQAYGIKAKVLPLSSDPTYSRARAAISEDVCLPALATTEDILYRVEQPNFDPDNEVFFQGNSNGPCRYGMYYMLQTQILRRLGLDVRMTTLGIKSAHGGLGTHFALITWDGFIVHDLLQKMLHASRPYEANNGESNELFERYVSELCRLVPAHKHRVQDSLLGKIGSFVGTRHLSPLQELLQRAKEDFAAVNCRIEDRPLIGLIGEFFVRINAKSNQHIIRKIEELGGEVWLAPATEFFSYANRIGGRLDKEIWQDTGNKEKRNAYLKREVNHFLAMRDEHALWKSTLPFLEDYEDIGPDELIQEGSKYVHYTFGGEAICSMGKSEDFTTRGLDGIVSVIPFNCMPGNVVTSLSQELRQQHHNIPFLNLDFDGFIDTTRQAKLENFMWQVKERCQ